MARRARIWSSVRTGDPAEPVAARRDSHALHVDIDVVPMREVIRDRLVGLRIGLAKVLHRLVGEHDAPAKRVVGRVALDHRDVVRRVCLLHEEGEIEPGRPSADDHYLHLSLACGTNGT